MVTFSVNSPLRWDTLPQLLSAGPIPQSFDVTWHATKPNTNVYGVEYYSCYK